LWVAAYPVWRYLIERRGEVPFIPAVALLYFLSYGLPAFNRTRRVAGVRPGADEVEQTLILVVLGVVSMLIASYWARPRAMPQLKLRLDLAPRALRLLVVAAACLGIRAAFMRTELPAQIAQLFVFTRFLPVVALSALLLLRLRGQLSMFHSMLGAILLVVELLVDVASGAVAEPAFALANLLFVYMAERRRLPLTTLAVIAILLIPTLATKLEYRRLITKGGVSEFGDRLQVFGRLIGGVFTSERMSFKDADDVAEGRVDHLSAFSFVVMKTPQVVPYWDGATYADFFWSFIPRVLAPEKPTKETGQSYGHRYGFLNSFDHNTSINLEQIVEMYANFGTLGVILGMFAMGILYGLLYIILNHGTGGDGALLIAAATFRVLLNIESDFSLVFGGIVQSAVLLYLSLWLIARAPTGASKAQPAAA
jgi:hypothetical protein